MRYNLIFLVSLLAIHSSAMENPRSQLSSNLNDVLCHKLEFLSGSPEAHQNIREKLVCLREVALVNRYDDSYKFFDTIIANSSLKMPLEFLDILYQARRPSIAAEETVIIEKAYNLLNNVTNFFVTDRIVSLRGNKLSTYNFFNQLSKNSKILDAYSASQEKTDATSNNTFSKTISEHLQKLIAEHEIKFPENSSNGRISASKFLELNAKKLTTGNNQMEQITRTSFLVMLTLKSLKEDGIETKKRLAIQNKELEELVQKNEISRLKDIDCAIS